MRRLGLVLMFALGVQASAFAGEDVEAYKRDLQTGDDAHADQAAAQLAASKDAKAVDAILDVLALGVPPRQAQVLLGGLSGKRDPRALAVLAVFAKNRNAELRRRAIELVAGLPDPKVVPMLVSALSDTAPEVRAAASAALGKRKERSAEGKLMQLLERQDPSAPAALAAIATPDLAHRLAEKIGPIPDSLLCDTFGEILKRPDFGPDQIRMEIVKTLAKIPGEPSTMALMEYIQASQKDEKRPSRVEAQAIVSRRGGT
jgi:HEAT repeat protein